MKGFAMLAPGKVGFLDKSTPSIGAKDALVQPLAVSPCTSDIHTVYEGAIGERHDMVLGHEAVGIIAAVGAEVRDFAPGDRVIVPAITPDWGAERSQAGYPMHSGGMLSGWKFSNFKDGVFAEYFHVNDADANLAHLPDWLAPEHAVMLCDMATTGLHGAELADIGFGDSVVVIGIGAVGLMAIQGAKLRGAGHIYAVGTRPISVATAQKFGANSIINYKNGPLPKQILDLTHGEGVDRVIIAGGTVDTLAQAIEMVKPGGIVANVNYFSGADTLSIPRDSWGAGMAHKTIRGGLTPGGRRRMEKLLALVQAGRLDLASLVTHVFEGIDKIPEALELMHNKPADLIKPVVLLNPSDTDSSSNQ